MFRSRKASIIHRAIAVTGRHRLLDQTRLAGNSGFQRELAMARGWCRDVDGVDVGILNERARARVNARDVMPANASPLP